MFTSLSWWAKLKAGARKVIMVIMAMIHFARCFRSLVAVSLLMMASSSMLQARIGETELECNLRYGRSKDYAMAKALPLVVGANHREYSLNGWAIHVAFVNGVAVREEYFKPSSAGGPVFKPEDVEAILAGEKGTGSWKAVEKAEMFSLPWLLSTVVDSQKTAKAAAMGKVWVRSDGALLMLRPGNSIVRVESADAAKIDEQIKKETEKKQRQAIPKF